MYKLVHTHIKSYLFQKKMHLVEQYILFKFFHNVKHILNQERDIIIHVILKKNITRDKIIFFVFLKFFNVFGFFFKKIKNNPKKNKTTKNRNKTCPQTIERIKLGTC